MKNWLALILIAAAIPGFSQSNDGKNLFKVNLSAIAFKSVGVQFERQIGKRTTIAVGYSTIPESPVAFQSLITDLVDDPSVNVGAFRLGTSILTPEFRYYVGKKGAYRGFYLAPYGRLSSYNMQVPVSFTATVDKRTALFTGKINNSTLGLMLGSQFKLGGKLYLDWWIVGASIGSASGNLDAAIVLNAAEQQNLRNELDNIEIPFTSIESIVTSNGATVKTTGTMAGVRGLGINLGIRF